MLLRNTQQHFGFISKFFHWSIALLIITLLALGWWMVDLNYYDLFYHRSLSWHKSLGIILGIIVVAKFLWCLFSPIPGSQATLSSFELLASRIAHFSLSVAMFVLPLSGYIVSSSEGTAIEVFNWFAFPALLTISDATRDAAINIHYYLAYVSLAFVMIHIVAAIKHQFIDGKDTLKRML